MCASCSALTATSRLAEGSWHFSPLPRPPKLNDSEVHSNLSGSEKICKRRTFPIGAAGRHFTFSSFEPLTPQGRRRARGVEPSIVEKPFRIPFTGCEPVRIPSGSRQGDHQGGLSTRGSRLNDFEIQDELACHPEPITGL